MVVTQEGSGKAKYSHNSPFISHTATPSTFRPISREKWAQILTHLDPFCMRVVDKWYILYGEEREHFRGP